MEQENGPQPVQIMEFETPEDPTKPKILKFHKDRMDQILEQAGDRRVAIISIAGPSRQGKSFFLGFMIRYLEALEKDKQDWMDHDNKDKPLTGFKWRSGIDYETSGILMWSKPFIVKMNKESVAVLLIDTQGTFDSYTTQREWSAIVGLSLLSSSCLIFNFFNNLQEDALNSLETYIQYGLMALGNEDDQMEVDGESQLRPFQKLLFLIRDWSMPAQYPYGSKGGNDFLNRKLQIDDKQPLSVQRVRKTIRKCFDQLGCFLMPDPGEKAKAEGFNGSLSQLTPKYIKNLEDLVSDLLNPDDLPLKSIFGTDVIASDVSKYFEQYVEIFNGEDIPEPTTLMEATAKISNQTLISKFKRQYVDNMKKKQRGKSFLSNKTLEKFHKTIMKDVLEEYKMSKKIGNPEMISSYEEDLIWEVKEQFDKLYNENEKKKSKLCEEAINEAIKSYRTSVKEEFDTEDSFFEEKKLKSISRSKIDTFISDFKDAMSEEDEEELEKLIQGNLLVKLEEAEATILTDNRNNKMKAEKMMNDLVTKLYQNYAEDMNNHIGNNPFMNEEELTEYHEDTRKEALEKFNKINKVGSKDFVKTFFKNLEAALTKEFEEVKKTRQIKLQETEKEAEDLLNQTIGDYRNNLSQDLEDLFEECELEIKHQTLAQEAENFISLKNPFPHSTVIGDEFMSKFKQTLQTTFESVVKDFGQAKKDCEESYRQAVEKAWQFYLQEMDGYVKTQEFHLDDEMSQKHDKLQSEAVKEFDNYGKIGVHPNPEQFCNDLATRMQLHIVKTMESNDEKRELAHEKAKNLVNQCHRNYQSEMVKNLDLARDDGELDDFNNQEKEKATKHFESTCLMQEAEFLMSYIDQLKQEIDETYEDDLKDAFEMTKTQRDSGTNAARADARKYYKEEMEKHYRNTEFMRPKALQDLHEQVSKKAVDNCIQKTPLSAIQKEELITALEETYQEEFKKTNDMNVPVNPAIGIDLGTTYSCVAVYWKGKVTVIPNAQGKNTTPSYVCYNDKCFVESIGDPAKSKAYADAENTIYDAKRIIGRKFDDEKLQDDMKYWAFQVINDGNVPKIKVNEKAYYPEQVSSEVLKEMRAIAEKHIGCEIKNAVITVPAYFSDGARQATMDAGELAGLKVLNIMSEPTAAAVAYKLQHTDDVFRHGLIFDLGGGTFDVAVLKMSKGNIEVLSVDGDTHLGGEDFDQNTMKYCALEFQREHGFDLMKDKDSSNALIRQEVRKRLKRLQLECERKKILLASSRKEDICVDGIWNEGGQTIDLKVSLARDKFEELNEELFEKTIEIVQRVLESAKLEKSRIQDIILVGGSTRIPKVQDLLSEFFDGKALNKTLNPDEAVAYGAALQAAIMNGQLAQESVDFNKIQDVSPMSLGVEVYGGGFSVIIPKNAKLPTKIKEQYRTAHNNQTSVQITIYQGEDNVAKNNDWLGEFYLNGIPPADAGRETIDVTMEIGLQGILHVTAVCTSTGDTDSITVTEHKRRMGRETIKRILDEATPGGA